MAAIPELPAALFLSDCRAALLAAGQYMAMARHRLGRRVAPQGCIDAALLTTHQHAAHGLAWIATYVAALRALLEWAETLEGQGALSLPERLILSAGFGEYLAQLAGGIAMSQGEFVRPVDLDLGPEADMLRANPACARLLAGGNGPAVRDALAASLADGHFGDPRHDDEMLSVMAGQLRRFVTDRVAPDAHGWHRDNAYIPLEIIHEMAELGVFGLTIPEEWGGSGLGKLAMCIASEELSRGYIGVGSLGTRSEIAGELIRLAGTDAQRSRYLPPIASGELLPTAVFTEPDTGSDLASLRTRAELVTKPDGSRVWRVTGNKTWITHAARADIMTLLVRTDPAQEGYKGLSMLLAEKPRGDDASPFPADGMSGGEIEVLGYRGMKEFEISFDGFEVPEENLLGGVPGQGFKQLMETFESARIQTAARAVGVAQDALEEGLRYALDRRQFGQPLISFPRVSGKLAWMAVETMMARQLSYAAARAKDGNKRCDIEAGMAKLLAARVAWSNADNALQIHGGNGFALEYRISRLLCDARILSIFEGAAEIQAQVIARGLLAGEK
ncbi:acyl-CoA dehydrogenase family protein [Niveispirillum sp. KHB5.9]|uniref:acyl-CoA dehydrogenase family protein n=1 Tax=Niveispirillum sp. KHB5.9 TaxID=3400269 RepID=UPI003A83E7B1